MESRLSGSERGWATTRAMGEIMWHRRDHFAWSKIGRTQCARRVRTKDGAHQTRRPTENTNFVLPFGECPAYSKPRSPQKGCVIIKAEGYERLILVKGSSLRYRCSTKGQPTDAPPCTLVISVLLSRARIPAKRPPRI